MGYVLGGVIMVVCLVWSAERSESLSREAKVLWPEPCLPTPACKSSQLYRSLDGSCNNLEHPAWGMANTPLVRLLKARYDDDVSSLPKARSGQPLPLARSLRTLLFTNKNDSSDVNTLATMAWGQFITHDTARISSNAAFECCTESGRMLAPEDLPPYCLVVEIPEDDEFYSQFNHTCFGMTRTATVDTKMCSPSSPAHQISVQTHFIDASTVYGVSKAESDDLRSMQGGELKTQRHSVGHEYLPDSEIPEGGCAVESEGDKCYKAGDNRVNQHPPLAVLHTLFVREHNLLCRQLSALNPHWSDERLFQEARRIVVAQIQHITYSHYLPAILGDIAKQKLGPTYYGYSKGYTSSLNPGTLNSFVAAAFRAFHSTVPGYLGTKMEDLACPFKFTSLSSAVLKPGVIQEGDAFDDFLRGLVLQPAQEMDPHSSEQITDLLFNNGNAFGIDLEATDILRGRDHGVPSYNTFRSACGLQKAKSFSTLADVMPKAAWTALSNAYEDVEDIDLYVGGKLETKLPGSLVGPTFQCILMEQFTRWKYGDRFFYEFGNFPGSFDLDQLREVKKASLSLLMCRNGNSFTRIQPDGFKLPSHRNEVQKCRRLKQMNLKPWKEYRT